MNNCIFCKIANGDIPCVKIWEDKYFLAFLDINPISEGMTIVIPKKHKDSDFTKNNEKDLSDIMRVTLKVSKIIKNRLNVPRVGVIIEGLEVTHLHIKLIPIRSGDSIRTLINSNNSTPDTKYLQQLALKINRNNQS
jgi:histidine triad (HIT) family protein